MSARSPHGRLPVAVALVSVAAIAFEILLMRILSIVQWHHFAWMIISLALLGYGASGTVIALGRRWLQPRFDAAFSAAALCCALAMPACLWLAQRVPFNALEILWDPRQLLWLTAVYLSLMPPFLFAAVAIGLAFACRGEAIGRLYFADLLGAGLGAALVIAALWRAAPAAAVALFAMLPLAASAAMTPRPWRDRAGVLQFVALVGLAMCFFADWPALRPSEFKALSEAAQVVEARTVAQRSGPLAALTVVESPRVPFRHAPGLSLNATQLPPPQLGVFADGEWLGAIDAFEPREGPPAYLDDVTAAAPYRILQQPGVLVLGAGTGQDVLLALRNGAREVDAVELNPQLAELLGGELAGVSGNLYAHPRVRLHVAEARGYVARTRQRYDLLQVSLLDAAAASGAQAVSASYLYTTEAIAQYLGRLKPGGLLSVTRWVRLPPRDSLKLAATVIGSMEALGLSEPGRRLVVLRSWNTVTLLARNEAFTQGEIETLRDFARQRSFDLAWYAGMPPGESNRFNRLDRDWLHEGLVALLGPGRARWIGDYRYDIRPATDDRPYFLDFFRWSALPEMWDLRQRGGAGLVEWGYLVLLGTLAQALLAGGLLILAPLAVAHRGGGRPMQGASAYFLLLGFAFLFVEMAFIQKFTLFLAHPLYAVAVVLAGFLVFAGAGSMASTRLVNRLGGGWTQAVRLAALGILVLAMALLFLLPWLFTRLAFLGDPGRIAVSLALIAPLAFCMGMPFPLGIRWLAHRRPGFIPWAWGLNGFASVVGAALGTLLAIELGFNAVVLCALALYAVAALVAGEWGAAEAKFSPPAPPASAPSPR